MLYSQDKLLLNLKNSHLRGLKYVEVRVTNSTTQILNFFIKKGYILSASKVNSGSVRVQLNCSPFSPLLLLVGNFSKNKTTNLSSKMLLNFSLKGKKGLFFSPKGLVDLSESLHFQQHGGVRPIFLNRY